MECKPNIFVGQEVYVVDSGKPTVIQMGVVVEDHSTFPTLIDGCEEYWCAIDVNGEKYHFTMVRTQIPHKAQFQPESFVFAYADDDFNEWPGDRKFEYMSAFVSKEFAEKYIEMQYLTAECGKFPLSSMVLDRLPEGEDKLIRYRIIHDAILREAIPADVAEKYQNISFVSEFRGQTENG